MEWCLELFALLLSPDSRRRTYSNMQYCNYRGLTEMGRRLNIHIILGDCGVTKFGKPWAKRCKGLFLAFFNDSFLNYSNHITSDWMITANVKLRKHSWLAWTSKYPSVRSEETHCRSQESQHSCKEWKPVTHRPAAGAKTLHCRDRWLLCITLSLCIQAQIRSNVHRPQILANWTTVYGIFHVSAYENIKFTPAFLSSNQLCRLLPNPARTYGIYICMDVYIYIALYFRL
jgi:hypothetical protein